MLPYFVFNSAGDANIYMRNSSVILLFCTIQFFGFVKRMLECEWEILKKYCFFLYYLVCGRECYTEHEKFYYFFAFSYVFRFVGGNATHKLRNSIGAMLPL